MSDKSQTEELAFAVHAWLSGRDGSGLCQAGDVVEFHWPCWHLATRLGVLVDELGWRTSPSAAYREGELAGRLDIIRRILARDAMDPHLRDDLENWRSRLKAGDARWWGGVAAVDGPGR